MLILINKPLLVKVAVVASLLLAAPAFAVCKWEVGLGDYVDNPDSCYRNGERHGRWEERWSDGTVWVGSFVKGKKHGRWELRWSDGTVHAGPFVNGLHHGQWEWRYADGAVDCATYEKGEVVSVTDGPCK